MNGQRQLGLAGESFVANKLVEQGYKIVARNFSCKFGEIDLICQKNEVLAFVEVKTRQKRLFLSPSLVNHTKKNKIYRTSLEFLVKNNLRSDSFVFRFDTALVCKTNADSFELNYVVGEFNLF